MSVTSLLDAYFESTPALLGVLEPSGRIVKLSRAFEAVMGRTRCELEGRYLAELLHGTDRESPLSLPNEAGTTSRVVRCFAAQGGSPSWLSWGLSVRRDGSGLLDGVAHEVAGASGEGQMQSRLMLAERMAALGTLAAGIAHEINNPLTYVTLNLGYVQGELGALARALSPREPEEPRSVSPQVLALRVNVERASEAVRVAREGSDRVAAIVRDLRLFARADDQYRGPIDVRRVLDSSISLAWNEIRHRARLVKDYAEVEPVLGNEAQLGQVFLNLLMNAAQSLPDGGASSNELRVVIKPASGRRVAVEVHDTGAGIAPENIDRVFDPFFTTRSSGLATGLGLSVCHGIVTALGGEIEVESQLKKGSTFRVLMPCYQTSQQAGDAAGDRSASKPSVRPRMLIVDDEPFITLALKKSLEQDIDVETVNSGREAIDLLLRDQRFDVVLCDLMMPDIAGMDVYEAVRLSRPGVEERFVLMTGGAFTPRARDFVKAVPNPCLDKPLDLDEVRRVAIEARARRSG